MFVGNDIARPLVIDLRDRQTIDLTDALSAGGRRLEMEARAWSADGTKVVVEAAPSGYNGGRDLAVIAIEAMTAQYVASMSGPPPLWTAADYWWSDNRLNAAARGRNGPILRKTPEEITWASGVPDARPVAVAAPACP